MTRFELGISGIRSDCSTFCTIRAKMLQMVHSCQLFAYFPSFSTKVKKFTANKYEKMSIQYTVLVFESTTLGM